MKITLKALRVNAGYTIEKASEALGISTVTLRSYETKKTIPNMEMLNKMLKLYGQFIVGIVKEGDNLAYRIMNETIHMYGYSTFEEAMEKTEI